MEYHEKRLDSVYLNLNGWFSRKELDLLMQSIDEGFDSIKRWKDEQETEEFKQGVARAIANSDGKTPPKIEVIVEERGQK